MLLPCWMKTEKLYLKLSLFLIRRMAATLYFPSFSPILLIPPILILAWKILIADLIRYGQFVETRLADEDLFSLRTLTRFRTYLVESISDLKRKVVCVLDQVFPEYQSIFSNIFGKTSKEILLQFSSPIDFENISSETLAELLAQLSRQKIGASKAEQLKAAASSSFGITFAKNSFTFHLKALIGQISFIENQVKETESEISHFFLLFQLST